MDWERLRQCTLTDANTIYDEFSNHLEGDPDLAPDETWESLKRAATSTASSQWSEFAEQLMAYLEQVDVGNRLEWCSPTNRDALAEGFVTALAGAYEPPVDPFALWSAVRDEMYRKIGNGDIPPVTDAAEVVQDQIAATAWYGALGQPCENSPLDVWVIRCLDGAQRNIGVDLSSVSEAAETLQSDAEDSSGAFWSVLRVAVGSIAETLVTAGMQRKRDIVESMSVPETDAEQGDALDGLSLRILFGEADIQSILDDEKLTAAFEALIGDGTLQVEVVDEDEL